jgi:hypothetical protein
LKEGGRSFVSEEFSKNACREAQDKGKKTDGAGVVVVVVVVEWNREFPASDEQFGP